MHDGLQAGTHTIGSRHQCFVKGLKNGLGLPIDESFTRPYSPIVAERKYCGKADTLPADYDRMGGLHECYQSGVGVGKRKKASSPTAKKSSKVKKSSKAKKSPKKVKKSPKKAKKSPKKAKKSSNSKKSCRTGLCKRIGRYLWRT